MSDYTKDAPSFAAVATAEEFKTATAKVAPAAPAEVKGTLTKAKALALAEYFSHIGDNPCAPKYCGVNVDIAADKVGVPRSMAQRSAGVS